MPEHITLRGFVGKDPESHQFEDGTVAARFRVATTTRRFDADKNTWVDTHTNWYSVRCFRHLAMHVLASVRCGQPVLVTGKLQVQEWMSDTGPRTVVQVDATAVGHDLSFGTANFARTGGAARPGTSGDEATDGVADPALNAHERVDLSTGAIFPESDPGGVFSPPPGKEDTQSQDPEASEDRAPLAAGSSH